MDDGEDKKRRRQSQRSYPHRPAVRTASMALASARLHLLGSHQESAARTADAAAMRSNFFGSLAGYRMT